METRRNAFEKNARNRVSRALFFLITVAALTIAAVFGYARLAHPNLSAYVVVTSVVAFDFDAGSPPPSLYQNTPFNYATSSGVAARFSSPFDAATPAFSVQDTIPLGYNMSMFSGQWLYDNQPTRDSLDIKFNAQVYDINLTFATIEQHGGPGVEPCYINLTAYVDSTGTIPVGWTSARGVTSSEQNTQGTLSFNSNGQPFNLVRIQILYQPAPKPVTDFFIDNIIITAGPTANPIPGDINGDFVVDVYDAIILATAFLSNPNSSNWNPNADINKDSAVDIYDAIILAINFGKTA